MNTQKNPLVSVIIPCYNAAPYVAETIESIIAQTYTNWECIIIDDHSSDNSWQIIESYQQLKNTFSKKINVQQVKKQFTVLQ